MKNQQEEISFINSTKYNAGCWSCYNINRWGYNIVRFYGPNTTFGGTRKDY